MMGRQPPIWEDLFISCHGDSRAVTQPHPSFPHPQHHLGFLNPFLINQTAPQDFLLPSHPSGPEENSLPEDLLHLSLADAGLSPHKELLPEQERHHARLHQCRSLRVSSAEAGAVSSPTPSGRQERDSAPLSALDPRSPVTSSPFSLPPQRTGGGGQGAPGETPEVYGRPPKLSSLLPAARTTHVSGYTGSVIFILLAQVSIISHCFLPSERGPLQVVF